MKNRIIFLRNWLYFSDKVGAQIAVMAASIVWAVLLLAPERTTERDYYVYLHSIGNDYFWAWAFIFSALMQGVSVFGNVGVRFKTVTGMIAVVVHSYTTASFFAADYPHIPVGSSAEVAICIVAAVVYLFQPTQERRDILKRYGSTI